MPRDHYARSNRLFQKGSYLRQKHIHSEHKAPINIPVTKGTIVKVAGTAKGIVKGVQTKRQKRLKVSLPKMPWDQ